MIYLMVTTGFSMLQLRTRRDTFYTLRLVDLLVRQIDKALNDESYLIECCIQESSEGIGRSIEVKCLAQCQNWMVRANPEYKLVKN